MILPDDSAMTSGRPRLARIGAVLLPLAAMVAALALTSQPASANPAGPHDPIGKLEKVTANKDGSVHFIGWAADPDTPGNVRMYSLTDGRWVKSVVTSIARPKIAKAYHTGATPGFDFSVPVPKTGVHTTCVVARNIGTGLSRVLSCVATPLGTRLTSRQQSKRSPRGKVSSTTAGASSLRVRGWALEPDYINGRVMVVLYVDGVSAKTIVTHSSSAAQHSAGAGKYGAFDITVPVSSGSHLGCVWLVNTGFGSNSSLGCAAADTRGKPGTSKLTTPAVNRKVVTEAKKHIGQRYVWGAAGPKTFDCSGLVTYSYHKAGVTTPRIAADQFTAARLIPASRAVAGDLVFYHDSVGSVYHVGIYLAPNDTVAAIDEQEGVAHQHIWDPSSATYGSLTHT